MLVFCKEQFKANAPSNIKRALPDKHIIAIDGLEVDFRGKHGIVTYELEGDETGCYLYPISTEWCRKESQMTLF